MVSSHAKYRSKLLTKALWLLGFLGSMVIYYIVWTLKRLKHLTYSPYAKYLLHIPLLFNVKESHSLILPNSLLSSGQEKICCWLDASNSIKKVNNNNNCREKKRMYVFLVPSPLFIFSAKVFKACAAVLSPLSGIRCHSKAVWLPSLPLRSPGHKY